MIFLRQLWLVVRKNFLIRWRNPALLLLELFWPVLIFTIVAIIRQVTLPASSESCHYPALGLPSAGLLPFVQSLLCGLSSPCLNATQAEALPTAGLNTYMARLGPLKDDPGASRAIRQIPSTLGLLASFQRGLEDPGVAALLNGTATLGDFVDDWPGLEALLSPTYLSQESTDALLHASFNFSQVFHISGSESFHSVVCDPKILQSFLSLQHQDRLGLVSQELCRLTPADQSELLNTLQSHLSTAKLLETMAALTSLVGDDRTASALRDVGGLVDSVARIESAANLSAALPSLAALADSLPDLWSFFAEAEGRRLDLGFLEEVVGDVENMVADGRDRGEWESFRQMLHYGRRLLNWFKYNLYGKGQDHGAQFGDVFGGGNELERVLRDAPIAMTSGELASVSTLELPQNSLDSIYQVRTGDDLQSLLCGGQFMPQAQQFTSEVCSQMRNSRVWNDLVSGFNLTWLHEKEVEGEEAEMYRGVAWSTVAAEARQLSAQLKQQLADPDSLLSRTLDFANSVRFDPIYQSARMASLRSADGSSPPELQEIDSVFEEASTTLWGLLRSVLGRSSRSWRDLVYHTCNAEQVSNYLLDLIPKSSTAKLSFGGLLSEPTTLDDLVNAIPSQLPQLLRTLQSNGTADLRAFLATKPGPEELKAAFCDPGRMLLFFDFEPNLDLDEAPIQISALQAGVCRFSVSELEQELGRLTSGERRDAGLLNYRANCAPLLQRRDPLNSTAEDLYRVYRRGRDLETALGDLSRRYAEAVEGTSLDWDLFTRSLLSAKRWDKALETGDELRFNSIVMEVMKLPGSEESFPAAAVKLAEALNKDIFESEGGLIGKLVAGRLPPRTQIALMEILSDPSQVMQMADAPKSSDALCAMLESYFVSRDWAWNDDCVIRHHSLRRRPLGGHLHSFTEEVLRTGLNDDMSGDWDSLQSALASLEQNLRSGSRVLKDIQAETEAHRAAAEKLADAVSRPGGPGYLLRLARLGLRLLDEGQGWTPVRPAAKLAAGLSDLFRAQLSNEHPVTSLGGYPTLRTFLNMSLAALDDSAAFADNALRSDAAFKMYLAEALEKLFSADSGCGDVDTRAKVFSRPADHFPDAEALWAWLCDNDRQLREEAEEFEASQGPRGDLETTASELGETLGRLEADVLFLFDSDPPVAQRHIAGLDSRRLSTALESSLDQLNWDLVERTLTENWQNKDSLGMSLGRVFKEFLIPLVLEKQLFGGSRRQELKWWHDTASLFNAKYGALQSSKARIGDPRSDPPASAVLWPHSPTIRELMDKAVPVLPYLADSLIYAHMMGQSLSTSPLTQERRRRLLSDGDCDADILETLLPLSPYLSEAQKAETVVAACFLIENQQTLSKELDREDGNRWQSRDPLHPESLPSVEEILGPARRQLELVVDHVLNTVDGDASDVPVIDFAALFPKEKMPFYQFMTGKDDNMNFWQKIESANDKKRLPGAGILITALEKVRRQLDKLDGASVRSLADFVPADYPGIRDLVSRSSAASSRLVALLSLSQLRDPKALYKELRGARDPSDLQRMICEGQLLERHVVPREEADIHDSVAFVCNLDAESAFEDIKRFIDFESLERTYAPCYYEPDPENPERMSQRPPGRKIQNVFRKCRSLNEAAEEKRTVGDLKKALETLVDKVERVADTARVELPESLRSQWEELGRQIRTREDPAGTADLKSFAGVVSSASAALEKRAQEADRADLRAVRHAAHLIARSLDDRRWPSRTEAEAALEKLRGPMNSRLYMSPRDVDQILLAEKELLNFINLALEEEAERNGGVWDERVLLNKRLPARIREILAKLRPEDDRFDIPLLDEAVSAASESRFLASTLSWLGSEEARGSWAPLSELLRPGFDLPAFLERTFGPVPRFSRAFALAFVEVEKAGSGSNWDGICEAERDGSWGGVLSFPPSAVDSEQLQAAFCSLLRHPILLKELRRQIQLPDSRMPQPRTPRLRLMDAIEDDAEWAKSKTKLSELLSKLEDAITGNDEQFDDVETSAPEKLIYYRGSYNVKLVRDLLDVGEFMDWAQRTLGVAPSSLQLWLGTHLALDSLQNPRDICEGGRLVKTGLIGAGSAEAAELEGLLCGAHYPALLDRLPPGFRLRRRSRPAAQRWEGTLDRFRGLALNASRSNDAPEALQQALASLRSGLGSEDAVAAERLNRFTASLGLPARATVSEVRAQSGALDAVLGAVSESMDKGDMADTVVATAVELIRTLADKAVRGEAPEPVDGAGDWLLSLVQTHGGSSAAEAALVLEEAARNFDRALQPFIAVGLNLDTMVEKEELLLELVDKLRDSVRNATRLHALRQIETQRERSGQSILELFCGSESSSTFCRTGQEPDLRFLDPRQLQEIVSGYSRRFGPVRAAPLDRARLRAAMESLGQSLGRLGDGRSPTAIARRLLRRLPELSPGARTRLAQSVEESLADVDAAWSGDAEAEPLRLLGRSLSRALGVLPRLRDSPQETPEWEDAMTSLWSDFKNSVSGDESGAAEGGPQIDPQRRQELIAACEARGDGRRLGRLGAVAEAVRGQLSRFPAYKGVVCRLNGMDPEALYQTLRDDLGIIDLSNSVRDSPGGESCSVYVGRLEALWGVGTGVVGRLRGPEGREISDCLSRLDTDLFATMDRYMELAAGVARLAANPEIIDQLIELQPAFEKFIDFIAESAPVLAPVGDVVIGTAEEQRNRLRQAGADDFHITTYLESQIDINYVILRSKAKPLATVVETSLCDPVLLAKLLRPSPSDEGAVRGLSKGLCFYHQTISSGLDVGRMASILPGLRARSPRDQDWLGGIVREGRKLVESASALRTESQKLLDAADVRLSELTPTSAWDLLNTFQRTRMDNLITAAQKVAESSGRLMGGSAAEAELERLLRGVFGLQDLQLFIGAMMDQPYAAQRMEEEVRSFLVDSLGVAPESLDKWSGLQIDLRRILLASSSGLNSSSLVCSARELSAVAPSAGSAALGELSAALCPLAGKLGDFGPRLLQKLDLGALFRRFVERGMEAGLRDEFGEPLSEAEAQAALQDIRRLPKLMRLIQGEGMVKK